jgi:hypothetical protein
MFKFKLVYTLLNKNCCPQNHTKSNEGPSREYDSIVEKNG